jgi:deoxyribodipyrimidine photolyase-related protein
MRHFAAELREAGDVEVVERRDVRRMRDVLGGFAPSCAPSPTRSPPAVARGARRRLRPLGPVPHRAGDFAAWADGRRRLVMEDFYREQRRRFGLLLAPDGRPEGGRWNLDSDNRRPARAGLRAPEPWLPEEDDIDAQVRRDLDAMGLDGTGADGPRLWPATAAEARRALDGLRRAPAAAFGPWQDAMVQGERWLFHSRLSSSFNLWLLDPLDACRAVQDAYDAAVCRCSRPRASSARSSAGASTCGACTGCAATDWRELDALGADRPLPDAFWSGETDAECLRSTLQDVHETAYAHHIQRLMVLGNLMLLLGVRPWEAVEWFQASFIDGAEWVMAPNVAGMATFADGGTMMTKPYAGGGNYVDRMSTYCGDCVHEPRSCPVTALYWDFMARHADGVPRQPADARAARRARADGPGPARRAARAGGRLVGGPIVGARRCPSSTSSATSPTACRPSPSRASGRCPTSPRRTTGTSATSSSTSGSRHAPTAGESSTSRAARGTAARCSRAPRRPWSASTRTPRPTSTRG